MTILLIIFYCGYLIIEKLYYLATGQTIPELQRRIKELENRIKELERGPPK
jgi:hypothetical protein